MENEILLIDKPADMSSFGVVARIRRVLSEKAGKKVKVGHTGTLDPFATGLLILLTGKMTKKSDEFLHFDKTYEATLKLGYTSTTGDPEGEITEVQVQSLETMSRNLCGDEITDFQECPRPTGSGLSEARPVTTAPWDAEGRRPTGPSERLLQAVISSMVGEISQRVPAFSAVKIDGQRAYKLARAGKSFETPVRKVKIYSIDILEYNYPYLKIKTHVSSGTYIRTLAEDIGKKLGTGAYLTALRRTEIADYKVEDAKTLEDFGVK